MVTCQFCCFSPPGGVRNFWCAGATGILWRGGPFGKIMRATRVSKPSFLEKWRCQLRIEPQSENTLWLFNMTLNFPAQNQPSDEPVKRPANRKRKWQQLTKQSENQLPSADEQQSFQSQILEEFKILQSLIPGISNRPEISEVSQIKFKLFWRSCIFIDFHFSLKLLTPACFT